MSQIQAAPFLTMPEPLQTIFFYATVALTIAYFIYCAVISARRQTAIPLLLMVAGFCSIPLESIVTYLGHGVHPAGGNIMLFQAVDRSIPWHIALGYTVAFGLFHLLIWQRVVAGTITARYIWIQCLVTVVCYQVFESAGVSTGLWVYYGLQPVWVFHFTAPLTWSFLDAACMVMGTGLIIFLLPYLTGAKRLLIPILGPVGAYMGHMGAGWPMYNVMNSGASPFIVQLSGIAAILLSVLIWWFSILLIMIRVPDAERLS